MSSFRALAVSRSDAERFSKRRWLSTQSDQFALLRLKFNCEPVGAGVDSPEMMLALCTAGQVIDFGKVGDLVELAPALD